MRPAGAVSWSVMGALASVVRLAAPVSAIAPPVRREMGASAGQMSGLRLALMRASPLPRDVDCRHGLSVEAEVRFACELGDHAVEAGRESHGGAFGGLHDGGDQAAGGAGSGRLALEGAIDRPLRIGLELVARAGERGEIEARKARPVARPSGAARNTVAGGRAKDGLGDLQLLDENAVELQPDVRRRVVLALVGGARPAQHVDDLHLDRLDFQFAAEQLRGRPLDADVPGAQPDAIVINQGDVGEGRRFQRITLHLALDADGSERADAPPVDLGNNERPAAIAGDPVAQEHAGRRHRGDGDDNADRDPRPERDLPALRRFHGFRHQNACPMEI